MSFSGFQPDPSLQQEDENFTSSLPDRFLGGDLLSCLDSLIGDVADSQAMSASIATWMLAEGVLKPCSGKFKILKVLISNTLKYLNFLKFIFRLISSTSFAARRKEM